MKHANSSVYYFLLAALCVVPSVAHSAIRVTNVSRNNRTQNYQQQQQLDTSRYQDINASQQVAAATPQGVVSATPVVPVSDDPAPELTSMERCAAIYPNGEFAWARPTIGHGIGGAPTCTAVVKLVALGAGDNGADFVIATANLASGDSVRCNINDFPASTQTTTYSGNIEISVPANKEPTMDDVIQVMNQEQKQNAAMKIISSSVITALAGNMMGANEPGKDSLLGGGKDKVTSTVVGALGGAALAAGSVYSGKVAGDMIMSAGVNAVAGSVVGNVAASGDSVLRIEDCTVGGKNQKCLWGVLEEPAQLAEDEKPFVNKNNISDFKVCKKGTGQNADKLTCKSANLTNVKVQNGYENSKLSLEKIFAENFKDFNGTAHCYTDGVMTDENCGSSDAIWIPITAEKVAKTTPAMIVDVDDKAFGIRAEDWQKMKSKFGSKDIYGRTGNGVPSSKPIKDAKIDNFKPIYLDSDDGGMIDMDNKARLKGTLTGAGVGGAMGAFTAYQGAQSEIEQRWVAAVREYKDSLQKVVCITGNRFLSQYNDTVFIPALSE